jgi:RHS repeat-associated protein
VAASLSYDAWGRVVAQTGVGFVSLGYAGGLYDHHTGLVRFGVRDYDASVGRWTVKDPAGFAAGTNAYCYVGNDPIGRSDQGGLSSGRTGGKSRYPHNYNCRQTLEIIEWVRQEAEVPWFEGMYRGAEHHSGYGYFDFKMNEPGATFIVNGRRLGADEFGNFLAGYTGAKLGPLGTASVRLGGIIYDYDGSRHGDGTFDMDEDSMPMIRLGIAYARQEVVSGRNNCDCP